MPIYLNDLDVISEVAGLRSVLIVPCNMCARANLAVRKEKPFIELFRTFPKSAPLEEHIRILQSSLGEKGVDTSVFESNLPHQFLVCMWTSGRRNKLLERAKQYEAVIDLGCDSAAETVRDSVKSTDCKVIRGMEVGGLLER